MSQRLWPFIRLVGVARCWFGWPPFSCTVPHPPVAPLSHTVSGTLHMQRCTCACPAPSQTQAMPPASPVCTVRDLRVLILSGRGTLSRTSVVPLGLLASPTVLVLHATVPCCFSSSSTPLAMARSRPKLGLCRFCVRLMC